MKFRRVYAVMTAVADLGAPSVFIHGQKIGMCCRHPGGWTRRRGAKRRCNPRGSQLLDHALQPIEAELAGQRLEARPGKLSHTNDGKSSFLHQADLFGPSFLWPMFGIIGRTKMESGSREERGFHYLIL